MSDITVPVGRRIEEDARRFVDGVRRRIAEQVAWLDQQDEEKALAWIEAISEFDNDAPG
jgi:hypothetical protein